MRTTARGRRDRRRALATLLASAVLLAACAGESSAEPSGPTLPPDVDAILSASAVAMGDVTSVRFDLARSGQRVYIDQFDKIALDRVVGEFAVPQSAQAVLDVEVNDSLKTQLAAIALGDEVWLSNPITGTYETLPEGYDIDPSKFFDPENGWRPLLANLADAELVGVEDGDYHVRGTATSDQIRTITAGLVRNQDVGIEFRIDRVTGLVASCAFTTDLGAGAIDWTLELTRYGEDFTIEPPEDLT
ncbi:MAG: LppX_LprAFG lipoprotein [Ilumatobacter sp.]|nr:LppX_LprAFG lipoprotein [Ilumatobacter sp.]